MKRLQDSSTSSKETKKRKGTPEPKKPIPVSKLLKWNVFQNVDVDFLKAVHLAFVYKNEDGYFGFLVNCNDDVYAVGDNGEGVLGIGIEQENLPFTEEPRKVKALCQKSVINIQFDDDNQSCAAITESGELYTWGNNFNCVLGHDSEDNLCVPRLVKTLAGKPVKSVAFGSSFVIALLKDGQVYSWGCSGNGELGIEVHDYIDYKPQKIEALAKFSVESVAVGNDFCVALMDSRKLFVWGANNRGQLGMAEISKTTNVPLELKTSIKYKKVVCGSAHVLGLSMDGSIYTWGDNRSNQLGTNEKITKTKRRNAVKVNIQNVEDIAVHKFSDLSSCRTIDGTYYIWGKVIKSPKHQRVSIQIPLMVPCKSFHEVFYVYAGNKQMHEPLTWNTFESDSDTQFEMALIHQEDKNNYYSDFTFIVEGKEIRVSKAFLQLKSEHFVRMFANEWKEKRNNVAEIKDVRHKVFFALLFYLCAKDLIVNKIKDLMDLISLSDCYLLPKLQKDCELRLKQKITVENSVELFLYATEARSQIIQEFAFEFMSNNWRKVSKTKTLSKLSLEVVVMLIETVADNPCSCDNPRSESESTDSDFSE